MNKNFKNTIIKYAICIGISAVVALAVLFIKGFFTLTDLAQKYRYLSDAFVIPGVLFMAFAGMIFVSDEGSFDGVGFAFKKALRVILPFIGLSDESYADYRERKHQKGKTKGYSCMLFTGLAFFLVGVVFMVLFNQA